MRVEVEQRIAPIRYCFFVPPDDLPGFRRAAQIACSLWGGMTCPILPFYSALPDDYRKEFHIHSLTKDFYENALDNFDVDVVLYEDSLDLEMVGNWCFGREHLSFSQYESRSFPSKTAYSIAVADIALCIAEKEYKFRRTKPVKFWLAEVPEAETFLEILVGTVPAEINQKIRQIFSHYEACQQKEVNWQTIDSYREGKIMGLRSLMHYGLEVKHHQVKEPTAGFYLMNATRLRDINNFWNLRAAGWQLEPIFDDPSLQKLSQTWFNRYAERFLRSNASGEVARLVCVVAEGCDVTRIKHLHQAFLQQDPDTRKLTLFFTPFPRYWGDYDARMADGIMVSRPQCESHIEHCRVEQEKLEFKARSLPFQVDAAAPGKAAYKVTVSLAIYDDFARYAGLMHAITKKQLNSMVVPEGEPADWRISYGNYHRFVPLQKRDVLISLLLPKARDFFRHFFNREGYDLKETVNSKLSNEVYKNMGGFSGSSLFLKKQSLKILELFEGGKVIVYATLLAEIKRRLGSRNNGGDFILKMRENKIIEFGRYIKCTVCEQHGFFAGETIVESVTCPHCRNQFALPTHTPNKMVPAYRGIGPFARSNKADGVFSVFATLNLFMQIAAQRRISSITGFELMKSGKHKDGDGKEIDLCLAVADPADDDKEPDLIFCECKTYHRFEEKDIERMRKMGDAFPGAILVFATLNDELTGEEKSMLTDLVTHFYGEEARRPVNPVLILVSGDLLPDDSEQPGEGNVNNRECYRQVGYIWHRARQSLEKRLKVDAPPEAEKAPEIVPVLNLSELPRH